MTWQKISTVLGILVSIAVLIGCFSTYINRFAKADDVKEIQELVVMNQKSIHLNQIRIEQKIVQDRIVSLEERRDRLELKDPLSFSDKERIKEYNRDIKVLEMQLRQIANKVSM